MLHSKRNSNSKSNVPAGKGGAKEGTVSLSWKRLSLSDRALFSLFPSLHSCNTVILLQSIAQHLQLERNYTGGSPNNSAGGGSNAVQVAEALRLVSCQRLITAFQCAHYMYNSADATTRDNSSSSIVDAAGNLSNSKTAPVANGTASPTIGTGGATNNTADKDKGTGGGASQEIFFRDLCFAVAL